MIKRSTWFAILAFAVVLAGALLFTRLGDRESDVSTPTAQPDPLWTLQAEDIESVEIQDLGQGITVKLQRDAEAGWVLLEPESGPAEAGQVEQAVTSLLSPIPARVLEVTDRAPYGLAVPRYEVVLLGTDESTNRLLIGAESPTGAGYYVAVPGDENTYLIRTFVLSSLLAFLEQAPLALPSATPEPAEGGSPQQGGDN